MKVHVNIAKEYAWPVLLEFIFIMLTSIRMLYEFHKTHCVKHPGALHATYLLYGVKSEAQGDDVDMAGSMPGNETVVELVPTMTLSLVPEQELKGPPPDREKWRLDQLTFTRYGCNVRRNYFHPRLQPRAPPDEGKQ